VIILKLVGIYALAGFGLYMLVGLALISQGLVRGLIIFFSAPLWGPKQIPDEYQTYVAPVGEQIKEIPGWIKDLIQLAIFWICLPFRFIWALAKKAKSNEQAVP
jgi:uncharacterized membrane protein